MLFRSKITPKNDVERRSIEKNVTDFESIFIGSQVASCDNLISLFTPRYEADPQDLDLAKNIVRMMGMTDGCTDNDLFLKAVTTMYTMEPSYTSAYYLYKLYAGRNDMENAIKYMDEAIAYPESDNATDAAYWLSLLLSATRTETAQRHIQQHRRQQSLMKLSQERLICLSEPSGAQWYAAGMKSREGHLTGLLSII